MAALHEIGFDTPEDYKETALYAGDSLLEDVLDATRHLNTMRRTGLFDDFVAAENAENPDYEAVDAKMKAAGYLVYDQDVFNELVKQYPDTGAETLDDLIEKIETEGLAKGDALTEAKAKRDAAALNSNDIFDKLVEQYPDTDFKASTLEKLRQEIKEKNLADDAALALAEAKIKIDYALTHFADARYTAENPHLQGLDALAEKAQGDDTFREKLQLLAGYYEQAFNGANGSEDVRYVLNTPHQGANRASFSYDEKNESLSLKVMDLNGTGLNFALNINKATDKPQSLVLTNDNSEMSEEQIRELACFFYKGGLVKDPNSINLPSDIKVLGNSEKNFREIFNEAFMGERNAQEQTEEKERQELSPQNEGEPIEGATTGFRPQGGDEFDAYLNDKPLNPSERAMKAAMNQRAKIMGMRKDLLSWRRNLDGSMTLVAYLNEADERTDAELDKKGIQARKKAFAVRVHVGPPPKAWLYMEPSKEVKSSHAKMILKAFQSQGCEYFIPSSNISGAANSAFFKAAGSIPMCPKLKCSDDDNGFDGFANDNLQEMLKVHKEEAKIDPEQSLLWKMRLVRELRGYTKYKANKGKQDGKLVTAMTQLEGEIKFSKFQSSYQGEIEKFINEGVSKHGWNTADLAAAYAAVGELVKGIHEGTIPYNFLGDYVGSGSSRKDQQADKLLDYLTKTMAEKRPEINKEILTEYDRLTKGKNKNNEQILDDDGDYEGTPLARAGTNILGKYSGDFLNKEIIGSLKSTYGEAGDIKFSFASKAASVDMDGLKRPTPVSGKTVDGQDRQALYNHHRQAQARVPMPGRDGSRGA